MKEKSCEYSKEKKEIKDEDLDKISGGGDPFAEVGVDSYEYDDEIKNKA